MSRSIKFYPNGILAFIFITIVMACHHGDAKPLTPTSKEHRWIQVYLAFKGDGPDEIPNEMAISVRSSELPIPIPTMRSNTDIRGFRLTGTLESGKSLNTQDLKYSFDRPILGNSEHPRIGCVSFVDWAGNIQTSERLTSVSIYNNEQLVWKYKFTTPVADTEIKVPNCSSPFFPHPRPRHT